jgi:hypothetical protein
LLFSFFILSDFYISYFQKCSAREQYASSQEDVS